ncbi:MAG: ROK family protein, partial [Erysipelotrichaceae bacterium]|nr:ROK family protein [Erysipelotrichaceae bacterium]
SSDLEKFNGPDSFVGYTCSTRSLLDEYKKLSQSEEAIDGRQLFERLSSDKAAKEALDHLGLRIAKQIYNLYWILDLEKVAIGGGISAQPALIEAINTQFKKLIEGHPMAKYLPIKDLQIVKARYGNEANQIGAFLTYLEQKEA